MQKSASKIIDFIKYNNAAIIIFSVVFIFGAGVFAAEPDAIGQKQTRVEGIDNTLLLAVDLENHDFGFKIEKIESDEKYYYATFTYLDISVINSAWQYGTRERTIKVTKNLKEDLGGFLAGELGEIKDKRLKELMEVKAGAIKNGEEKRIEVIEYTGLIGKTMNLAGNVFPGYEPVKKIELPTPATAGALTAGFENSSGDGAETASGPDNLTQVYNNYITENDPDSDNIFGNFDNCPNVANSGQEDADGDGNGDACDLEDGNANGENSGPDNGATGDGTAGETPTAGGETAGSDATVPGGGENSQPGQSEPEDVQVIELPVNPEPVAESEPALVPADLPSD
ncbi:MAG: hypothetical protein WCW25_02980 [Patescibacteria group bacterium]|jgi:hypothetical protein